MHFASLEFRLTKIFLFFARPFAGDRASPDVCKSFGDLGFANGGEALLPERRPRRARTSEALFVTSEASFVRLSLRVLPMVMANEQEPKTLPTNFGHLLIDGRVF